MSLSTPPVTESTLHPKLHYWFRRKRWSAFSYQEEAWAAYRAGESGLVNAPTGMGKTYSLWMGPLSEWLQENADRCGHQKEPEPPQVLWITPLRALSNDTATALRAPIEALRMPWSVELRTGDTSAYLKQRQRQRLPTALVTTPESLSVLLSYEETHANLATLKSVVVDEWHELLGTKRGVQVELGLARLRAWNPALRVWGLSATLGNLPQAMQVLLGSDKAQGRLICGPMEKDLQIDTLLPDSMDRFPWSGHIGLRLLEDVIRCVDGARTTLLFTNTRAQAELWFQSIQNQKPEWRASVALHHGSLDREIREQVEERLRRGTIRCVVCTSSLDLGVDFPAVDQVIQVGSPKGIARLIQRAGRSGHQPGRTSRVICVPTHAFELVEYAASRESALRGYIENREPLDRPIDVLVQHLVTLALGGGFDDDELYEEVRRSYAFQKLSREEFNWALGFVTHGGTALRSYPQFQKVVKHKDRYTVGSSKLAKLHRLNIGTITGDLVITVKLQGGGVLGTVEENFIARLNPGNRFVFAGRVLELVRMREATAIVRFAADLKGVLPSWGGSRMPITSELGRAVRDRMDEARRGHYDGPEMEKVRPVLEVQRAWSAIPAPDELLVESLRTREGYHLYVYPFEGRFVHEGLGALVAYRIAKMEPRSIGVTMNDYGFEMVSAQPIEQSEENWKLVLSEENLLQDLLECLNAAELARRHFREIARVAGLIFGGYPGAPKTGRQIQASSSLIYDVFEKYDPDNLLLDQSRREVLERQLEVRRLRDCLARISKNRLLLTKPVRFTPLAFPLWATRIGSASAHLSTEPFQDRIQRMVMQLEEAFDEEVQRLG